jgi:integrase
MPVYKDKNGTWYAMVRYDDLQGKRKQKCKRGFLTKREAQNWERRFLLQSDGNLDMTFSDFYEIYKNDMIGRLKQNTWESKEHIITTKILPYFGDKQMKEIQPKDVLAWQNSLLRYRNSKGTPYSETYLKSVHNQLSAILNHAVRFYGLISNPATKAGSIGVKNASEMDFWTKDEYLKFSEAMMDKPVSYYAFEMLYWCGIRLGELLALTPADFDFQNKTLRINKSYQRIKKQDVITDPKTKW